MSPGSPTPFKLSITQKGLVLVLVPVVFELVFLSVLFGLLSNTLANLERLDRSKAVILEQHRVYIASIRSFVMSFDLLGEVKSKELRQLHGLLQTKQWGRVNEDLYPELKQINDDSEESRQALLDMIEKRQESLKTGRNFDFSKQTIFDIFQTMSRLGERTLAIEEQVTGAVPMEVETFRNQLLTFIAVGLLASTGISLGLAYFFSNDVARRLLEIKNNTFRLAAQVPLPEPIAVGDEISSLDRVLFETSKELTELRERESAILNNAADVICSLDANLRFQGGNAAIMRLWSYEDSDLSGKSLLTILDSGSIDGTRAGFQLIAEGAGEGDIENIVRTKDGERRNILWTVKWSAADSTFYCIAHDVTEIRAVQKLKQDFLAIAGHDLRSPLTSISMRVGRLVESKDYSMPNAVRGELYKTQGAMTRLIELVNELLELEKLEVGKLALSLDCISAADVCALACQNLEGMASRSEIKIEKPKGDYAVIGDERRMIQVVTNLLSNALKFSPAGSTILIELRRHTEICNTPPKDFVEIRISDQGPGIPAEDVALIFDKFRQSRSSTTNTAIKGTGLGLAIVKAIVEAHGGSVGVESDEGRGSTFWVRVPEFGGDEEA
jgi:PAS domain S-box